MRAQNHVWRILVVFMWIRLAELPFLDRGRSAMKTSLAGIQPAYIRIIKRRNTGSGPAYALEFMKQHSHLQKRIGKLYSA
jgi:hypothetical protein